MLRKKARVGAHLQTGIDGLDWKDIISQSEESVNKADFSFRRIIKNSRGVLGKVFRQLGKSMEATKLEENAGELAGDFYLTLEVLPMSVAKKTNLIEQLLTEPILSIIEDLNDEEKAGNLEDVARLRITEYNPKSKNPRELTDEQSLKLKQVASKIANNVKAEIQNNMEAELDDMLDEMEDDEEYQGIDWFDKNNQIKQGIRKILESKEFTIGYVASLTHAMLKSIAIESLTILEQTYEDPEVRLDEDMLNENTFGDTLDDYLDDIDKSWKNTLRREDS